MKTRKERANDAKSQGLCVACFTRPIYFDHSSCYCFHCFSSRKKANQKHKKLNRKAPLPRKTQTIEERKQKSKAYRERNKEKISKNSTKWRLANPERYLNNQRNWRKQNPGKSVAYVQAYNKRHPEMVTKSSRKRREIFKGIEGTFTLEEWTSICDRHENKCLWCGKSSIKLTIDHVIPISKGGSNYASNLQPLCARCNAKKNNRILDFRPFGTAILEWT